MSAAIFHPHTASKARLHIEIKKNKRIQRMTSGATSYVKPLGTEEDVVPAFLVSERGLESGESSSAVDSEGQRHRVTQLCPPLPREACPAGLSCRAITRYHRQGGNGKHRAGGQTLLRVAQTESEP